MSELDYEKDIEIDESALDVEWLDQANLALRYGRHYVALRRQVQLAEERVKTIRSDLIAEANEDPEGKLGKSKPNASDIEAYYRRSEVYRKAKTDLIDKEYELGYAEIAKNEISFTRKAALENLVTLHGQQYFAGPRIPRNLSKEWENRKRQKGVDEKIARGMRRERSAV